MVPKPHISGAIKGLRLASHETGAQLQERINEARALADEPYAAESEGRRARVLESLEDAPKIA